MKTALPDDLGPLEPGLDQLISMLTADPAPDELAGEPAALANFRASLPSATATAWRRPRRAHGPRDSRAHDPGASRASHARRTGRIAGVVALALAGGFAVAAYGAALPPAVQHVAYRALGFAGVPDTRQVPPRPPGSSSASSTAGPGAASTPGSPRRSAAPAPQPALSPTASPSPSVSASASPRPRPSASRTAAPLLPARLSVTVAQRRIAAGGSDSLTGVLTDGQGRAVPGQQLTLLERTAGQRTWQPAAHATTGPDGSAVLTLQDLTANATFRLSGPDGTLSHRVRVIAVPPVSVAVTSGSQPSAETLTASSPFAVPGDFVVLQVRTAGHWRRLRMRRLSESDQAVFIIKLRPTRRVCRVALLSTSTHGAAASGPVAIPPAGA